MLLRCSRRRDSGGGMIQISDTERRRAFSVWLRTGRWPTVTPSGGVEVKFNPWHDPADGRLRSRVRGALTGGAMGMGLLAAEGPAAAAVLRHDRQGHRNLELRKIAISHAQFRRPIPKARFHVRRRHRRELPRQTPTPRMAGLVGDLQVVAAVASAVAGLHPASRGLIIL